MRRRSKRLTAMVVLAAAALPGAAVTYAAYTATTSSSDNRVEAGSVQIGDDDGGSSALFSLTGMQPGTTDSGCIKVSYGGSLNSTVRLYGNTSGTGLDQYVDLKVTRGANSPSDPAFDGCGNFQADGTDYIGRGNGVIYDGTLQGFPDDYASGVVDPTSGSPESWTGNESHVYRFTATLQGTILAEGKSATQSFTWEARNQ